MISDFSEFCNTLTRLSGEAKVDPLAYLKVISTQYAYDVAQHNSRSASPDDKVRIDEVLKGINGDASLHSIDPKDILVKAGVRRNQGTSSYARHHLYQLRLSYKPAAAA